MKINELAPQAAVPELEVKVVSMSEVKEIEKPNFSGRLCKAKVKDDTGEVDLTLWNEQIDAVAVGDTIKITKGWVSEFRGDLQLSAGKFGKIEVVKKAAEQATLAPEEPETPAPVKQDKPADEKLSEDPINAEEDVI